MNEDDVLKRQVLRRFAEELAEEEVDEREVEELESELWIEADKENLVLKPQKPGATHVSVIFYRDEIQAEHWDQIGKQLDFSIESAGLGRWVESGRFVKPGARAYFESVYEVGDSMKAVKLIFETLHRFDVGKSTEIRVGDCIYRAHTE